MILKNYKKCVIFLNFKFFILIEFLKFNKLNFKNSIRIKNLKFKYHPLIALKNSLNKFFKLKFNFFNFNFFKNKNNFNILKKFYLKKTMNKYLDFLNFKKYNLVIKSKSISNNFVFCIKQPLYMHIDIFFKKKESNLIIFIFFNFIEISYLSGFYTNLNFFLKDCLKYLYKYTIYFSDIFNSNKYIFISNKYFLYKNFFNKNIIPFNNNFKTLNNYYPIILGKKIFFNFFFDNFKFNYKNPFSSFSNKMLLNSMHFFFKKFLFIKTTNNNFNKIYNEFFKSILLEYKFYKPNFSKNFIVSDFIEIVWYSFLLKDLSLISSWITNFMESISFRSHKKFLSFLINFFNKNSNIFINILRIKGFFFDIRGKVGVTGSSKKRHISFIFGSLNKSSKENKINFNQNLVRTYSGVMGLTYILNF